MANAAGKWVRTMRAAHVSEERILGTLVRELNRVYALMGKQGDTICALRGETALLRERIRKLQAIDRAVRFSGDPEGRAKLREERTAALEDPLPGDPIFAGLA